MKKLAILIAALIVSAAITAKTQAVHVDTSDVSWYTVAELLEYKEQMDQEFNQACGDNLTCTRNLHQEKMQTDLKYVALYSLEARTIVVTAINHKDKTFKILFFDERILIRKELGQKITKLVLKDLYLGWFDDVRTINEFNDGYRNHPELYYDNQIEGAHLMLGHRGDIDGMEWYTGYNQEVEYQMSDDTEPVNNLGTIEFKAQAVSGFGGAGTFGYSNCLKSEQYREELGCTMMVSGEKGIDFFPTKSTKEDEEPNNQIASNDSPIDQNHGESTSSQGETNATKNDNYKKTEGDTINASEPAPVQNSNTKILNSPNTGIKTTPCNSKTVEFPWWLVIVIAMADAAVLWLFRPKGKKSSKK